MIDKHRLREAILQQLAQDLDLLVRAAHLARDEAISEESKAENKYDTRAQEAAYLAQGQARQVVELQETITHYQSLALTNGSSGSAAVGSLLRLESEGRPIFFFLGPRAGGLEVEVDSQRVTVITPASPLGRQLLGARVGTRIEVPARPRPNRATVTDIW